MRAAISHRIATLKLLWRSITRTTSVTVVAVSVTIATVARITTSIITSGPIISISVYSCSLWLLLPLLFALVIL